MQCCSLALTWKTLTSRKPDWSSPSCMPTADVTTFSTPYLSLRATLFLCQCPLNTWLLVPPTGQTPREDRSRSQMISPYQQVE